MPAKAKAGADLKESDSDPVVVEPFTPSALAATPTPVAGGSTTYVSCCGYCGGSA